MACEDRCISTRESSKYSREIWKTSLRPMWTWWRISRRTCWERKTSWAASSSTAKLSPSTKTLNSYCPSKSWQPARVKQLLSMKYKCMSISSPSIFSISTSPSPISLLKFAESISLNFSPFSPLTSSESANTPKLEISKISMNSWARPSSSAQRDWWSKTWILLTPAQGGRGSGWSWKKTTSTALATRLTLFQLEPYLDQASERDSMALTYWLPTTQTWKFFRPFARSALVFRMKFFKRLINFSKTSSPLWCRVSIALPALPKRWMCGSRPVRFGRSKVQIFR